MNRSFRDRTNLSKSEMNFGIAPHKAGRRRKTEREREANHSVILRKQKAVS